MAVWHLCKVLWNRSYSEYWTAIRGYNWSDGVLALVDSFEASTRQQMMDLVQSAYSNISISKLASLLGLTTDEALLSKLFIQLNKLSHHVYD